MGKKSLWPLPCDCPFFFSFILSTKCNGKTIVQRISWFYFFMIFIDAEKSSSCSAEKKGANHICVSLLSINLLVFDVAGAEARARALNERQDIRFLCAKAKDIHKVVCISQQKVDAKRDLYFRSANGVSCDGNWGFCGCAIIVVAATAVPVVKHDRTDHSFISLTLSIIISFFNGSGILCCIQNAHVWNYRLSFWWLVLVFAVYWIKRKYHTTVCIKLLFLLTSLKWEKKSRSISGGCQKRGNAFFPLVVDLANT